MQNTTRTSLDLSDFVGFDWIFDIHGTLERLLDRVDAETRTASHDGNASGVSQ